MIFVVTRDTIQRDVLLLFSFAIDQHNLLFCIVFPSSHAVILLLVSFVCFVVNFITRNMQSAKLPTISVRIFFTKFRYRSQIYLLIRLLFAHMRILSPNDGRTWQFNITFLQVENFHTARTM